jgi:hypothetical protein
MAKSADKLLHRLRAEYLETTGLRLTFEQVQRFCGVEPTMCQLVLDVLVDEKFLCVKSDGHYARLTHPDNDDVVVRQKSVKPSVYVLGMPSAPAQFQVRTRDEAVAQALAFAKHQHVRAWFADDEFVLLGTFRVSVGPRCAGRCKVSLDDIGRTLQPRNRWGDSSSASREGRP